MSTFNGIFKEIPYISADRFEDHNLESKLFFLSHCHADHMIGISENYNAIGPLYTSAISAVFLRKQFPQLTNICILEIETPTQLHYTGNGENYEIVVTALPAQHCPGSIMLLFETKNQNILYTGDFRLGKTDLTRNKFLCNRIFDVIYLDSTFLSEVFNDFPLQIDSVIAICELIDDWLKISKRNKILIEMPAQYGYENLFISIASKLQEKIYVPNEQYQKYLYFPQMDDCISNDIKKCRISIKTKWDNTESSQDLKHVRIIKPSAMYWRAWKPDKSFVKQDSTNTYRVAYSNHSSCSELKDFLSVLKPIKVNLNVITVGSERKIFDYLEKIYPSSKEPIAETSVEIFSRFNNIFVPTPKRTILHEESPTLTILSKRRKWKDVKQ